jgi:hypothetical protein
MYVWIFACDLIRQLGQHGSGECGRVSGIEVTKRDKLHDVARRLPARAGHDGLHVAVKSGHGRKVGLQAHMSHISMQGGDRRCGSSKLS